MAVWAYQGRTVAGSTQGEVEASDRNAAVAILRGKGVLTTAIKEKPAGAAKEKKIGGKVKDREMAIFTRQFSTMIDAGLPLVQCLNILADQSESKNLRDVTTRVARDVEAGSSLAEAFRKHPKTFDDLFTNMVEVGESGGILDVVLQRLSVYIEKAVLNCRAVVTAGGTITEPLKTSTVFPPMVIQMINVGEQTGALDAMLGKIADFYDDEVDTAVGALTALLEPMMIVFLGVVIGGLVVAMYLPIFRLVTLVK